jgi:hypothetical protein
MHLELKQVIDCSRITTAACSDNVVDALGQGDDFKLRADGVNDVVHGSITIAHDAPPYPHIIRVEIYETDVAPELVEHGRKSTLARPAVFPTEQVIKGRLTKWAKI